eukprot:scaffold12.g8239.t1
MPGEKKAAPSHPPYKKLVGDAIVELKDRKGSTAKAITKAIVDKYGDKIKGGITSVDKLVGVQLKRLVATGFLTKPNAARFKLSDSGKKEAVKKPKVPKKPAAPKAAKPATKKPAAKKPKAAGEKKKAPAKPKAKKPAAEKAAAPKAKKPATKKAAAKPKAAKKAAPKAKKA